MYGQLLQAEAWIAYRFDKPQFVFTPAVDPLHAAREPPTFEYRRPTKVQQNATHL
jgi:hypothetical protein